MELAQMMRKEFPDRTLSGIGGVESGEHAAQFILLGAHTVQVCTGVMIHGYQLIHPLIEGLSNFMEKHKFKSVNEFRGHSLQFFTTGFAGDRHFYF
jgi:dihydroorotate dehydrogenase